MSEVKSPGDLEDLIHREHNRLRGRLAGTIESFGLPEKQERAAIQTLKTLSYDSEELIVRAAVDLWNEEYD